MSAHVDEEVIAAMALGDPAASAPKVAHVHACSRCAALLADFDRVQDLLRRQDLSAANAPAPDPAVWQRIAQATREQPTEQTREQTSKQTREQASKQKREQPAEQSPARHSRPHPTARPAAAGRRQGARRTPGSLPRPLLLAAAALACVLAGLGIGRLVWGQPPARVLAATPLAEVDGTRTVGEAQLLDQAGRTELRVLASPDTPASGFVEVWLLHEDGRRMLSLGVFEGSTSVLAVPPGAVNQGYRVVDLSRERYDGDARHSGDSIMRGTLSA